MSKLIAEISTSLDGFMAGPDISASQPLGKGGPRLHEWLFGSKTAIDEEVVQEIMKNSGSVLVGGRTYHTAIDGAWEGVSPFAIPAVVLTTHPPAQGRAGFTFCSGDIREAVKLAKKLSEGKDVWLMGGATIFQQCLKAGLVDEIQIHLIPVLFGSGTTLFEGWETGQIELEKISVKETPAATHIRYKLLGKANPF